MNEKGFAINTEVGALFFLSFTFGQNINFVTSKIKSQNKIK